jgi:outer membrane protein OmpA-like peptidoglycan-associated protein/Mg-chelatase subunit ChlD
MYRKILILLIIFLFTTNIKAQSNYNQGKDSLKKARDFLQDARIRSDSKEIQITIRNVDISGFPEINVIIEAFNILGQPLDTLIADKLTVLENGQEKKVISVKKISVKERVPVDFIFLIDKTGSMQKYINGVMTNISSFSTSLMRRGIDYRLGLVLFSDYVEKVYQPTDNVLTFLEWLSGVQARGGGDEKENALEAIKDATKIQCRPSANKVAVLITDAPYVQRGEEGDGVTGQTTESIINLMNENQIRVFAAVPPKLKNYKLICDKTRGTTYDIDYPFSTILDNFSTQLTNLFALKYRTDLPAIPDSINIALVNEKKQELVRKTIPIVELGRKLIIENLLYNTNSFDLPDSVKELEILKEFMTNKPNVAILVEGHTDSRGSHELNDALSFRRAESVKNYLVKKGINPLRIQTKGYGKRKPISGNETEFGRQLNRRTEIIIVSK